MNIQQVLKNIKNEFETAIRTSSFAGNRYLNGNKAKEALIRSQRLINYLHNIIKNEFMKCGVNPNKLYPRLNLTKPEISIEGFLKRKNQDICIVPNDGIIKTQSGMEKVLTVNVRSQLSSLKKNIDTLYERTFAEALNLHLKYQKQCLGEVYLIPTHEYDDKAMVDNRILFKNVSNISDYLKMFQAINNRIDYKKDAYKYERVCLLIVDFRQASPILYSNIKDLINDRLVPKNIKFTLDYLTFSNFANDMLSIYSKRFNIHDIY